MNRSRQLAELARHVAERTIRIATDRKVRSAYRARTHLRALRRIRPELWVMGVDDEGGATFVAASDDVITPLLLARGHFQRDDFHRAWKLAARLAPRPGASTFLDVGANVGTTTLYAARTGAFDRLVAVEPSPDNLAVLRLNIERNSLQDQVTVVPAAAGAQEGMVELLQSSVSSGDHRIRRTGDVPASHAATVAVAQRPLDAILSSLDIEPSSVALVWVDTQGHEPAVIAGAASLVADSAPFLMEFWPQMYAEAGTLDAHLDALRTSFRGFVDLGDPTENEQPMDAIRGLTSELLDRRHGQTDLLFLPR